MRLPAFLALRHVPRASPAAFAVGAGLLLLLTGIPAARAALRPAPSSASAADRIARIEAAYPVTRGGLAEAIVGAADDLGLDAFTLANAMHFESGFRAQAYNAATGATGLIQWLPTTAPEDGTSTAALYGMSAVDQMRYVKSYFRRRIRQYGPLDEPYKVAMAIFYPEAIGWSPWRPFPPSVWASNPGIYTPNDYLRKMFAQAKLPDEVGSGLTAMA